jgi:hypothetical protein
LLAADRPAGDDGGGDEQRMDNVEGEEEVVKYVYCDVDIPQVIKYWKSKWAAKLRTPIAKILKQCKNS